MDFRASRKTISLLSDNAVMLGAFMGSGSTGQACLKLNRKFIGIEMEEETYVATVDKLSK